MGSYLVTAFGLTQSEINNYNADYKNSLPIEYEKNSNSFYVALGGVTTAGTQVIDSYTNGYADQIANSFGFEFEVSYDNKAKDSTLFSADAVGYINGDGDRKKLVPTAIKEADLITFQIDGASFIESAMEGVIDGGDVTWEKYINDPTTLTEFKNFRAQMASEYAADYGDSNAESIAMVLEHMLYECIVYCHESMNAIAAIRSLNSNAVVLMLGLYNPMKNLSLTANGNTINIGSMIDQMISVCNTYLLKQTKGLPKTAFIDISATSTNGYGSIALNTSNSSELQSQLNEITDALDKQYANQTGHNYIFAQVTSSLKAPCKHTQTTVVNKKDPTCQETGYTGDTVCADCNKVITSGSTIAKVNHKYGSWSQVKAPTCTANGEESRTCSTCSHVETRAINAKNHNWDNGTVVTKPTCTAKGVKSFTCKTCNAAKTEAIATIDHTWNAGEVTTKPTCDAEGVKTFTCSACTATKTEAIATIDHTWDDGEVTTKPGCETEGEKTFTCTACTATKTEIVPAIDHAWDDGVVTTKPGCETEGVMTTTCVNCGKTTTKTIPATDHHYGEYTSNGDATCQKDGTKTAVCTDCGAKDTVDDPSTRTDHVYEDGVCTFCKAEQPSDSNNAIWWIVGISAAVIIGGGALGFYLYKKKESIKIVFRNR